MAQSIMATGIHTEKSTERSIIYKRVQEEKRKKWCFTDSVILSVTESIKKKGRILPFFSKEGDFDTKAITTNMTRLIIELHKTDPLKYVYPEQISEFLGIDLTQVKSALGDSRKWLIKIEGYTLRNKHGVGYRIADYYDLLIEVDKSIDRITGIDVNALKKNFEAFKSLELTKRTPSFHTVLRKAQSNLLTELSDAIATFKEERDDIAKSYKDFEAYDSEIRTDISSAKSGH